MYKKTSLEEGGGGGRERGRGRRGGGGGGNEGGLDVWRKGERRGRERTWLICDLEGSRLRRRRRVDKRL